MNAARDLIDERIGRLEFTLMLSMTMAVVALAIDTMLPALGDMRKAFGLDPDSNAVAGTVTFFFIGLAIGQMLWGTISDAVGRKRILYIALVIYIVSAIASAMAPSLTTLFIARFVWGIGAAGPQTIARSIVRDTYEGSAMAHAMSYIMAVFLLVPVFSPTIGSLILLIAPWQWVFVFLAFFGAGLMVWTRRLPETLPSERRIPLRFGRLVAASKFVLSNPMTMGYTLAQASAFGFFASYLASSQLIFDDIFGLDDWFPAIFGATGVIMGVVMISNTRILRRYELRPLLRAVFTFYMISGLLFATAMIFTDGHPSFALFFVMLIPVLATHALLIPNLNAIAMIPMGSVAGSAAAVIGTTATLGGALIGSIIDGAYNGSLIPFGLGAAATGLAAFGFMLWADKSYLNSPPSTVESSRRRQKM